jgi:hypothetical protein
MDKATFNDLFSCLEPLIRRHVDINWARTIIPLPLVVAAIIYKLAHGSTISAGRELFGIAESHLHKVFCLHGHRTARRCFTRCPQQ